MLNDRGHEVPDQTPVALPLQWQRPPTLQEQIRMFVRRELSVQAGQEGQETFEEADDFDVDDDYDPRSPWELNFDQVAEPRIYAEPAVGGSGGTPPEPSSSAGGTSAPPEPTKPA